MNEYLDTFWVATKGYANWLLNEVINPHWENYFYWLTGISLFFLVVEWLRPWRADQPKFRKDFWLDAFYMYFNYFIFGLIIFIGLQKVGVLAFDKFLGLFGVTNVVAFKIQSLPAYAQVLILFVVLDFTSWCTHRILHRSQFLWEFHKVHHSVEQMGFAAHLRYHWMENVVYKLAHFIPLSMIGFDVADLFAMYMFTTVVGHFNHSNITVNGRVVAAVVGVLLGFVFAFEIFDVHIFHDLSKIGKVAVIFTSGLVAALFAFPLMKFIFNSPEMHIWHHAHDLPYERRYGINFGITLSVWDWLFGTAYWPSDGKNIKLGFPGVEKYPKGFFSQFIHGWSWRRPFDKLRARNRNSEQKEKQGPDSYREERERGSR